MTIKLKGRTNIHIIDGAGNIIVPLPGRDLGSNEYAIVTYFWCTGVPGRDRTLVPNGNAVTVHYGPGDRIPAVLAGDVVNHPREPYLINHSGVLFAEG